LSAERHISSKLVQLDKRTGDEQPILSFILIRGSYAFRRADLRLWHGLDYHSGGTKEPFIAAITVGLP
jgi:hypothetical protein